MTVTAEEIVAAVQSGDIDWDAIAAQITKAAEAEPEPKLEDTLPMPEDLEPLRLEKLRIDKRMDKDKNRLAEIKKTFRDRIEADGVVGYTVDGKVRARRSPGTRTEVDGKKLKEKRPKLWAQFLKTTSYVSMRIS